MLARLNHYRRPSTLRSGLELALTAVPLLLLWVLAWVLVRHGQWWGMLFTLPAGGFLLRLFIVQHDCGHGSFFPDKRLNDWLGRAIGVFTLTPYDHWKRTHAIHHATSGDLDRRGIGDVLTLTVDEYLALPRWRRLAYRLVRHPAVMFGLGPAFLFLLCQRLPVGEMRQGWRPWVSTMGTNLAIALVVIGTVWLGGLRALLLVNLPIVLLAASIGVWLFYVQHQFEGVVWARSSGPRDPGERNSGWNLRRAALHGSSHYHLPGVLRWFTGNIGAHHVHHLSSRIPFYRLPQVLRDNPELDADRMTLVQSFRCVGLSLWDEVGQKLISFRDLRDRFRA